MFSGTTSLKDPRHHNVQKCSILIGFWTHVNTNYHCRWRKFRNNVHSMEIKFPMKARGTSQRITMVLNFSFKKFTANSGRIEWRPSFPKLSTWATKPWKKVTIFIFFISKSVKKALIKPCRVENQVFPSLSEKDRFCCLSSWVFSMK